MRGLRFFTQAVSGSSPTILQVPLGKLFQQVSASNISTQLASMGYRLPLPRNSAAYTDYLRCVYPRLHHLAREDGTVLKLHQEVNVFIRKKWQPMFPKAVEMQGLCPKTGEVKQLEDFYPNLSFASAESCVTTAKTLADIMTNELTQHPYDDGVSEHEHATQGLFLSLYGKALMPECILMPDFLASTAWWLHDIGRLISDDREEGHKEHHIKGWKMLRVLGDDVAAISLLHTLAKILLSDITEEHLSAESKYSVKFQKGEHQQKQQLVYLRELESRLGTEAVWQCIWNSITQRLIGDECGKMGKREGFIYQLKYAEVLALLNLAMKCRVQQLFIKYQNSHLVEEKLAEGIDSLTSCILPGADECSLKPR